MAIKAQLFSTCLSERFFPGTLERLVTLLERLGVVVDYPESQTCCGQPQYNSGFRNDARDMARQWLKVFASLEGYIVSPSASCVHMVRNKYPDLFPPDTPEYRRALDVAERTFEFIEFLTRVLKVTDVGARFPHKVTYHASCHLLRELNLREEPKQLLMAVRDLELIPLSGEEVCCGFGGIFSVVYPEVSRTMVQAKVEDIMATGAEVVVAGDAGCLMNIAGGLKKAGSSIKVMHVVDVLASNGGVQ